ncbi:NADH-quinone oxidoreductase subunit NuoE [Microbulbifer yueqingensis]|uniref:NADH-quinone oxidoreductase subunit E n=1 Tax=Microbulbifer yueqingensis TaxID=658219 RepID=A0A1G8WWF2_9GAMM|nr:NADH-quinone oxidoreductase subunit NuoE [Microbulbifer yueqingensis]SDJ82722.1 NADH dehydrogenase subunit E [Microbulbifer yueqingensis]
MSSTTAADTIEVMEHDDTCPRIGGSKLTAEEKREIDREFAYYEDKGSVGLEALRLVQRHRGWISDETLYAISDYLGISPTQLESIATCYQMIFRQPVGQEVLFLCKSSSCWIMGCERLQHHLQQKLQIAPGETTSDGMFTLLETPCLGDCDKAPVMMVGEEMHRHLTEEKLDELILEKKSHNVDQSAD